MILVVGTVRAPGGKLAELKGAIETMIAETLKEDGCIRYAFAQDLLDPDVMHVSEAWRDLDALKAHGKSAHMADWRTATADAGMTDRDIRMYTTDEGIAL
ncbi:putative quinol monooxygenase [Qipengyuania oceanensis]|uniref:Antibiotic biosynthesis monooxygenase n=1 Tax=Qipengyuania oceanensis TaxID=1463597 RepID=A0A844YIN4_9SPHN|nr:putative quinol monooxygenase [Qipengyuania oceanensis]MXO63613.1 antibiotic biosynthesis monooxygenase [Qipengyuania oceanensis]